MGAVRRMADGGNAVGAVTFHECPTPAGHRIFWVPAATSVTADAVFHRTPADHRPEPPIPVARQATGEPPTLAKNHCTKPVLSAARWPASRLAEQIHPTKNGGEGWTSGGRRRFVGAAAGAKVIPNTA